MKCVDYLKQTGEKQVYHFHLCDSKFHTSFDWHSQIHQQQSDTMLGDKVCLSTSHTPPNTYTVSIAGNF
jgi:hypothetical protein